MEGEYLYLGIEPDQNLPAITRVGKPVGIVIGAKLSSVLRARVQYLESIMALVGRPMEL